MGAGFQYRLFERDGIKGMAETGVHKAQHSKIKRKGMVKGFAYFFLVGGAGSFFLPDIMGSFFLKRKSTTTTMITAKMPP